MTPAESTEIQDRVPLAPLTSLGVGGPARHFARVQRAEDVGPLLDWAARRGLTVTLLGGGSNVVVADEGVDGLVLTLDLRGQAVTGHSDDEVSITVGAGEPWDDFVSSCVERGWAGVECLSGIPGLTGATPIQNVGAYGQEVGTSLLCVDVFDTQSQSRRTLTHAECELGYRTSRFKARDDGRFLVLAATFRLRAGGDACLGYPEIARHFAGAVRRPTLPEVRAAVLATRRSKSMLLDPRDENGRSCGSFFLNPELSRAEVDALTARATVPPPGYPLPNGRVKVPAAWLIENAGFRRGQRFDGVGISSRHALALVCHPGATAAQLVEAAHRIRDGVRRAFDVSLEPEPRFFGFGTPASQLPALAARAR